MRLAAVNNHGPGVRGSAKITLLPFGLPLRAQAWHPDRPPRGWSASRVFAYVPSQMHASARNFRRLHTDLAWLADRLPKLDARLTVLAGAETSPIAMIYFPSGAAMTS